MTTVFTKFDKFRTTEVKVLDEDATWPELAEEFFTFLQGCGYVLTREDFAAYWEQYLDYSEETERPYKEEDCSDCISSCIGCEGGGTYDFGFGPDDVGNINLDVEYATGGTMANSGTISIGDVTVTVAKNQK